MIQDPMRSLPWFWALYDTANVGPSLKQKACNLDVHGVTSFWSIWHHMTENHHVSFLNKQCIWGFITVYKWRRVNSANSGCLLNIGNGPRSGTTVCNAADGCNVHREKCHSINNANKCYDNILHAYVWAYSEGMLT